MTWCRHEQLPRAFNEIQIQIYRYANPRSMPHPIWIVYHDQLSTWFYGYLLPRLRVRRPCFAVCSNTIKYNFYINIKISFISHNNNNTSSHPNLLDFAKLSESEIPNVLIPNVRKAGRARVGWNPTNPNRISILSAIRPKIFQIFKNRTNLRGRAPRGRNWQVWRGQNFSIFNFFFNLHWIWKIFYSDSYTAQPKLSIITAGD
jgi:hypothetical protein